MSWNFNLYRSKNRLSILMPTRKQTPVSAAVQETAYYHTWTSHVDSESHVLEQRSVVVCDICWNISGNQLLIKFSLSLITDYCAKGTFGHTRCNLPRDMPKFGQCLKVSTFLLHFTFCSASVYECSKCKHENLTSDKKFYRETCDNYSTMCVHLPSCCYYALKHTHLPLLYVLIVSIIVTIPVYCTEVCVGNTLLSAELHMVLQQQSWEGEAR